MTSDVPAPSRTAAPTRAARAGRYVTTVLKRVPASWTLIGILLVVGIATGALWSPFSDSPLFETLAYGLPAFEQGRWWTVVTGTFVLGVPWLYPIVVLASFGMAFVEWKRGWRTAVAYFVVGQLFAIFAAALLLWLATLVPWNWEWAQTEAAAFDVGPSGGLLACIAAAVALLPAPWRLRGWVVLLTFVIVTMIFWGAVADLEHLLAVLLVLGVDRSFRPQRSTVREQRLVAFGGTIFLGVLTIVTQLIPTDGPFGATSTDSAPWLQHVLNIALILIVANGLRRGRRWAHVLTLVVGSVYVLLGLLDIVIVALVGWDEFYADGDDFFGLAASTIWLVYLIYLITVRGAFRARPRRPLAGKAMPTVDEVKDMIRTSGGGTLSWMASWQGNEYVRTSSGIVAYQRHAGIALALADPLGPVETRADSAREFVDAAQRAGLIPAFFSAGDGTRDALDGWRSLVVADDSIVDLPELQFSGKKWNNVRTAINRAAREDVEFRLTTWHDESWGIKAQLRAISEMWVGDKALPEMGFTLGTLDEAEDPEVRLALAIAANGDVEGFLSWLPVYAGDGTIDGWTLDLMRRREGGTFPTVMEFLIGSSARQFSDEGARIMSLSGAPLAHDYPADAGVVAALATRLGDTLEPVYGFASLHRFKEKFHPRYETMYLLYRDEGDLARVAAGLTRAFLPDATLRQFAGAGMELVTGR